ncbi:MAG: hypothetical protein CMF26_05085 [Kiloniella sp.]|nr:hypothetical protein [Kiloniella sp.]
MNDATEQDKPIHAPSATPASASAVEPSMLELLVCPLTKTTLHFDRDAQELVSEQAGLAFPIRQGIPILLVEEARRV